MIRTRPEFHFRDEADSTRRSSCCDVVDVCVNRELLENLTHGKRPAECQALIRLHWDMKEPDSSFLSTVLPYQRTEQSQRLLAPTYAVVLAKQSHLLQDFTSEVLQTYDARLVAVCYRPLGFIFNHGREFDTNMFTDKLNGILKSLIVKCEDKKGIQIRLKIEKGTKVDLPQLAWCGCLKHAEQDQDVLGVEKTDTACQANVTANDRSTNSFSDSDEESAEQDFATRVEERFIEMEKKISDHKKMIGRQFSAQKQQNEAIKMHILRLSNLSQGGKPSTNDQYHSLYEDSALQSYGDSEHPALVSEENERMEAFAESTDRGVTLSKLGSSSVKHGKTEDSDPDGWVKTTGKEGVVHGKEHVETWSGMKSQKGHGLTTRRADEKGEGVIDVSDSIIFDSSDVCGDWENEDSDNNAAPEEQIRPRETSITPSQDERESMPMPLPVAESVDEQGYIYVSSEQETVSNDLNDNSSSADSDASDSSSNDDNISAHLQRLLADFTQRRELSSSDFRPSSLFQHEHDDEGHFLDHYMQAFSSSGFAEMMAGQLGFQHQVGFQQQDPTSLGLHPLHAATHDFSDYQSEGQNFDVPRKSQIPGAPLQKRKVRDEQDGEERMQRLVETLLEGTHNKDYLMARFNDALKQDDPDLPYANSALDTVFCLDTSGSVGGDSFYYMKKIVLDYITEVEDIAERYEIEENLALVTFGEDTKIVQPLSNDYGNLRDTLEDIESRGHSPMLEGVITAIACMTKGGELNIKEKVKLPPRLVIFTDGLATADGQHRSTDVFDTDLQQKAFLMKAFEQLRRRQPQDYWQGQIVIVPVGRSNMSFLLDLARNCGGMLVDGTKVAKLGNSQRIHKLAANSLEDLESEVSNSARPRSGQRRLMLKLSSDIPRHEQEQIRDIVEEYKDTLFDYSSINTFCNVHEVPGLPVLGSRVTRGADWRWKNQDTEAAGTIFNHGMDGKYVWVVWDNSHRNVYRWGRDGCYDVQLVHDKPREPSETEEFYVGLQVKRGDGWNAVYGDQDSGAEETGVIIRERQDISRVLVKWQNGRIYEYRFGENNVYDVEVKCQKKTVVEELPLD